MEEKNNQQQQQLQQKQQAEDSQAVKQQQSKTKADGRETPPLRKVKPSLNSLQALGLSGALSSLRGYVRPLPDIPLFTGVALSSWNSAHVHLLR